MRARRYASWLALLVAALTVQTEKAHAGEKRIDLSSTDLFSVASWQQNQIAIAGFVLGMTREQAFQIASAGGLKLRSDRPPKTLRDLTTPCLADSCAVSQLNGNWIGINLFFTADRLVKIKISEPDDADPEVKKVNLARSFQGLTYEFFNNYSDDLRVRILGAKQAKETPITEAGQLSDLASVEYDYSHLGVVIHLTIDKRDHPAKPFDLEVDFIPPR